jgi:NTE family protein
MMRESPPSRTAFVLAGGGSLGAVQVGMLEALTHSDIYPEFLVGSSVGAINGAFFAAEPSEATVRRLKATWLRVERRHVFPTGAVGTLLSIFSGRNHLVDPSPLRSLLHRNLPYQDLTEAAIPCHLVATDVLTGAQVVLSSGPALAAMLASSAIPAVFPPVRAEGRYLVDGGIANNTPISVAVRLGATRVIVLPTGFCCDIRTPPANSIAMALHGLTLLIARQLAVDLERFAHAVDLRVVPPLCPLLVTPYDFSKTGELIERAKQSTREWLEDGGLERMEIPAQMRACA